METLQRIMSDATSNEVAAIQKDIQAAAAKNPPDNVYKPDYAAIEEHIMAAVKSRITQANNAAGKGEPRISMPKSLTFAQAAEILKATMTIRVITDGGEDGTQLLGIYNETEGIYETNQSELFIAATQLNSNMGKRDLEELIGRLMLICDKAQLNSNKDLVAVANGIFDYRHKELMDFSPDMVFLSKSAVPYKVGGVPLKVQQDGWDVESWLKDIAVDDEVCDLLWKTAGAALRPYVKWDKTVWLFSTSGNNGKGTYCELLRNLLGPKAYTSIPLEDFAKDFALSPLVGKQAIITDENNVGQYIDKLAIMKAVVTGDVITVTRKFKDPINYRFRGMMVQCLNEYPKVKDKSDSFYRRQIFIPFEKTFTGKENKHIKSEYLRDPEVLKYVLYKLLNMDYYELPEPDSCKVALADYKEINDPVRQFWAEFEDEFVWDFLPFPFLFDLYKAWYDENYPKAQQLGRPTFINALVAIVKRESIVWECPDQKKKRRPGNMLSKPELLIDQYKLKNWESKTFQGRDVKKRCSLQPQDLAASYAGLNRK